MKSRKSLLMLMVVSQCLLVAFVAQWLYSQYRSERSELVKDISLQFERSQQEVLDTLLQKNLIGPLLRSPNGFKVSMSGSSVDPMSQGKVKMYIDHNVSSDSSEIITVVTDSTMKSEGTWAPNDSDVLMHGVRLFVKEVTSNRGHKGEFERRIYEGEDSMLLEDVITKHFKSNNWEFTTRIVSSKSADTLYSKRNLFLESTMFPRKYGLEISGYDMYLFKKILPQSVFALVLLLLTGFAFIVSFRAVNNQIRLNAMKNDFIDNITHELKTPLTTVKVVVEALRDENIRRDDATMKEYLEMASMELSRLELLTGKILSTSMMEGGVIQLQPEKIDLLQLITDLAFTLKVRLTNEGATLTFSESKEKFFVHGDSIHIQGALLNLIDNSLKYSGKNAVIKISLDKTIAGIILSVKDNGPGIPEEYLSKIFDKFFRLPSGNVHNVKGHGLGLSYVASVMKIHGGSVYARNDSDGGSIFPLIFPENK